MRGLIALAFAALALGGCVTRADFERVRRDQQEMRAALADTQVKIDQLERRLQALEQKVTEEAPAPQAVTALADRVKALEARLERLEAGPAPAGGGTLVRPRSKAAAIVLRHEAERAAEGGVDPQYAEALDLYRKGQYEAAIEKFRAFLRTAGASPLADDAQFWIGECYYSQGDYNRAIIELNEVLLKYPKGDRVPAALLALATAFADSGDKIDARIILQKLIGDHPHTEEAAVAKRLLPTLGG